VQRAEEEKKCFFRELEEKEPLLQSVILLQQNLNSAAERVRKTQDENRELKASLSQISNHLQKLKIVNVELTQEAIALNQEKL